MFNDTQDEESYMLFGKTIGRFWYGYAVNYNLGLPHEVKFDFDFAWNNKHKLVGWIHTHPASIGMPSVTDHATMTACYTSFGKPLVCCIDGKKDGILRAHWYFDDENSGVESKVYRLGKMIFGTIPNDSRTN